MHIMVDEANSVRIVRWSLASVSASTLDVASSCAHMSKCASEGLMLTD